MGWFKDNLSRLKEASTAEPIQCPRGWGQVSFGVNLEGFPPFFTLSRNCPIGGVNSCSSCKYPFNPQDAERLRTNLEDLELLRSDRTLSKSEYAIRRQMVIMLQDGRGGLPGESFRIAAWILGPLGLLITGAGCWLATVLHLGFLGAVFAGVLMLALCLSFAMIALGKRETYKEQTPP